MAAIQQENSLHDKRRDPYQGEKRRFLREGFGTYVYENAFFRYEGEWLKGKKHGHGKLLMKDGTYYEGQFMNGEINGNGYKYFSSSSAKYTGQFLNGEMHGHGMMHYKNGNVYEGQWYKNKKQGFGVLRTSEKAVYEGTFHCHVRDGEGTQTYDNGDRYEGYWVLDKRQGHGDLWCADGTHYSGQFMNDLFNGDGLMKHASGIVYSGQWVNGFPITMATKIVLLVEETTIIIRQGQPFAIQVECRNEEGEVVPDQGRELQVSAGFKYRAPKQGSALFDIIEDVEEKPIPTPFGYDVALYPITDQLGEVDVPVDESDSKMSTMVRSEDDEEKPEEEGEEEPLDEEKEAKDVTDGLEEGDTANAAPDNNQLTSDGNTGLEETASIGRASPAMDEEKEDQSKEESSAMPLPAPTRPTVDGKCEWNNLQLAPPPPMYRPFVIMEEEAGPKKKSKLAQMREKMDNKVDEEDTQTDIQDLDLEAEFNSVHSDNGAEVEQSNDILLEDERKNSQYPAMAQKATNEPEKSAVSDEKIARTGEYVLMVSDVTSPPFMGSRLEPAFLLLKLKKPKKIIVKKSKWDTQRHIAMAMSRSNADA